MRWEKECPLRAQLPISASVVGRYDIVVGADVGIDRLVTDLEDAPDAAADRHSPAIIVFSLPIGRDERARGQVPALGEVIIEEGLQGHGIDIGAVLVAGEGPKVKDQKAGCYVQRLVRQEHHKSGTGRPLSRPKFNVRRGWQLKSWPDTPHQACLGTKLYRLSRRKEKFWSEIAQAELGVTNTRAENLLCGGKLLSGKERRLRDHWEDRPGDQVPILIKVGWIDGLKVEDVLRVLTSTNVKVRIVLKRNADQIGDGVLRGLTQAFSLLSVSPRCCNQHRDRRCGGGYETSMGMNHWSIPLAAQQRKECGDAKECNTWSPVRLMPERNMLSYSTRRRGRMYRSIDAIMRTGGGGLLIQICPPLKWA